MEKYQFAFHSEIIGYTSPHIGEVRKAIHRKVEKEKSAAIKNDIELHMYKVHDGIPVLLNTCYLYDEKGCMVHGSIKGTKDYLLETWRYHTNRHSKGFSSTRIRKVSEKAAFFFCYAARLLSIFIFKISLVFSIITFREVILQK